MHNGSLLLLAFVAVFQPIASYTERGLVDGRPQRCDYRTSVRDPGLNFHGTNRFTKPAVEDRRQSKDVRDVRRNEVREDSLRTASSSDRRLADFLERDRNTLKGPSRDRIGNDAVLRREVRQARLGSYREERNQEVRRERATRVTHEGHSQSRRVHTRAEYENRYQRTADKLSNENRASVVSRRDTRDNENHAEMQRVGENREIRAEINRVTRDGGQRMATQRFASRIRLDGNEILGQRSRDMELRTSRAASNRVNREYNNEATRMSSGDETASLNRDDRRISISRRPADERRQRDVSRVHLTAERRNILQSANRVNLGDRASENRREARFERARSTEIRKENRDCKGRLIRTVRSVDGRVSQNDGIDSRIFARERSAETRRNVRDARNVERFRALEQNTEYRKDSQSSDRARVLENQREIRNIETQRDNRNIERDSKIRGESRNTNRDTCAYDREQSTEQRMTKLARERSQENRLSARSVELRAIGTERVGESRQIARNNNLRSFNTERADQNRRYTRNYAEFRVTERTNESSRDNRNLGFRTERTEPSRRSARNVDSRLSRTERADETGRATRTARVPISTENSRTNRFRVFGTERATDSRRNAQDFERKSRSLERDIDYRRDSRSVRDARLYDRAAETRRNIRSIEFRTEDERVITDRRAARSLERESRNIERARTMESRLNGRMLAGESITFTLERRSEDRRERAFENRGKAANTPKALRTLDTQEGRRVDSRGINLLRSRDYFAQRKTDRAIERLSKQDSFENRHSYTLQRASRRDTQRTSERDNLAARLRETEARNGVDGDFVRKREFQVMFKNLNHAENAQPTMNWQYIFYTVQALYIGGLLMQLNKRSVDKKTRGSWWSAPQHLIKVE